MEGAGGTITARVPVLSPRGLGYSPKCTVVNNFRGERGGIVSALPSSLPGRAGGNRIEKVHYRVRLRRQYRDMGFHKREGVGTGGARKKERRRERERPTLFEGKISLYRNACSISGGREIRALEDLANLANRDESSRSSRSIRQAKQRYRKDLSRYSNEEGSARAQQIRLVRASALRTNVTSA